MDIFSPRVLAYAERYQCRFVAKLGFGREADVFQTDQMTAVKFFNEHPTFARPFAREQEVYHVLTDQSIEALFGHAVPKLIRTDADFRTIEMSIVTPPFILDFAGARLEHEVPDFEPHVEEDHIARLMELYGDRWSDVLAVARAFTHATGYVLMDIKPGNITF